MKKSKELLENCGFFFFLVCPKGIMAHFPFVVNHESEYIVKIATFHSI